MLITFWDVLSQIIVLDPLGLRRGSKALKMAGKIPSDGEFQAGLQVGSRTGSGSDSSEEYESVRRRFPLLPVRRVVWLRLGLVLAWQKRRVKGKNDKSFRGQKFKKKKKKQRILRRVEARVVPIFPLIAYSIKLHDNHSIKLHDNLAKF